MIPNLDEYKQRWQVNSDQSIKPGLEAMIKALNKLNHPESKLKYIHFAGTNGKGSTLTFVEQLALHHGLTVGKFMSPCVYDVHDQIQINGECISPAKLDVIFSRFKEAGLSGILTDFELLTCAALLHFEQEQVDLVLLEAGMGGRLDSTNVVIPLVSVIPSIALEHTNFLGDTLEKIAYHKAGIIKQNKSVIIGQLPTEAKLVIEKEAKLKNSQLLALNEHFLVKETADGEVYKNLHSNIMIERLTRQLRGNHQANNMAIAITAFLQIASSLQIEPDEVKIRQAIQNAAVPGRFEEVMPNVFFDGAHNPASIEALCNLIHNELPNKNIHIILGMLADKDIKQTLALLEPVASKISFIDISDTRAMPAQNLFALSTHPNKEVIMDAVALLRTETPEDTVQIVTGSLYLLADIRHQLKYGEK